MDRQIPTIKQETLQKGVVIAKFDFTKTFRNQLFSRVRVLYHQYSITNHSESKVQNHEHFNDYFVFFLSDLLRNILKCNCSLYSILMTIYLPGCNIIQQCTITIHPCVKYTLSMGPCIHGIGPDQRERRLSARRVILLYLRTTEQNRLFI